MGVLVPVAGNQAAWEEVRCGKLRSSMRTNVLLAKEDVGRVKRTTFMNPPEDKVFGATRTVQCEDARLVTMVWREHQPNPDDKPGPDFRAMNKLATVSGITTPRALHGFRDHHPVALRSGNAVRRPTPPLPSDKNPDFTYGRPAAYKTMEEIRVAGRDNPHMKHLMQNAYSWEWIRMNSERAEEFDAKAHYIPPRPTKATLGHTAGARQQPKDNKHAFKLTRFTKNAAPKIDNKRPAVIASTI